jgi:hypothetical protein
MAARESSWDHRPFFERFEFVAHGLDLSGQFLAGSLIRLIEEPEHLGCVIDFAGKLVHAAEHVVQFRDTPHRGLGAICHAPEIRLGAGFREFG